MSNSFWDTPAGREGLAARAMDRVVLNQARTAPSPAEPPAHGGPSGGAFEEVALDWCDHKRHYVPAGTTVSYEPRSAYRICHGCVEEVRAEVLARETYHEACGYLGAFHIDGRCPTELEARRLGGDR